MHSARATVFRYSCREQYQRVPPVSWTVRRHRSPEWQRSPRRKMSERLTISWLSSWSCRWPTGGMERRILSRRSPAGHDGRQFQDFFDERPRGQRVAAPTAICRPWQDNVNTTQSENRESPARVGLRLARERAPRIGPLLVDFWASGRQRCIDHQRNRLLFS
jgi:hypothetical protein